MSTHCLSLAAKSNEQRQHAAAQSQTGGDGRRFWVLSEKKSRDSGMFPERRCVQRVAVGQCHIGDGCRRVGEEVSKTKLVRQAHLSQESGLADPQTWFLVDHCVFSTLFRLLKTSHTHWTPCESL